LVNFVTFSDLQETVLDNDAKGKYDSRKNKAPCLSSESQGALNVALVAVTGVNLRNPATLSQKGNSSPFLGRFGTLQEQVSWLADLSSLPPSHPSLNAIL
jgi:hypothetical protein